MIVVGTPDGTSEELTTSVPDETYTCDDLVEEAVRISEEGDQMVDLLDVRSPDLVKDNLATYTAPLGDGEALVMRCEGRGVWSDGSSDKVRVEARVDAEEQMWVFYEPLY